MDEITQIEDWSTVSTDRVETLLVSWSARESAVKAELLAALAVFVERRAWEAWECVSPSQWLSWKCGLGRVAASEHVRAAVALTKLPAIHRAMRDGRLSWSKVREITRVATPESEQDWLELALAGTANHVERTVRAFRRLTPADVEQQHDDRRLWSTVADDGSVILHVKLPSEVGSAIESAIRATTQPARGVPLAARMADRFVDALTGGATVTPHLVIHADASVFEGAEGVCHTEGGHAVAPEVAQHSCCVGTVQWVVHDGREVVAVSSRRRYASPAQRRALAARAAACEIDGCDDDAPGFAAHHVRHRADTGPTEFPNLRRICPRHHRLVHLHHLEVEPTEAGGLRLLRPDGTPVDHWIRRLPVREATPPGVPIPWWSGEPLDLDLALHCLCNNPRLRREQAARAAARAAETAASTPAA